MQHPVLSHGPLCVSKTRNKIPVLEYYLENVYLFYTDVIPSTNIELDTYLIRVGDGYGFLGGCSSGADGQIS